jgi:hypothetical protein
VYNILSSLFSSILEIHSFETGVLLAIVSLAVIYFSREIGAGFLSVSIILFLLRYEVVIKKPWYFLFGLVIILIPLICVSMWREK